MSDILGLQYKYDQYTYLGSSIQPTGKLESIKVFIQNWYEIHVYEIAESYIICSHLLLGYQLFIPISKFKYRLIDISEKKNILQ